MRIISQNGHYDFPYEMSTLWVNDNKIIASPIGEPETEAIMAQYSTSEKVEKIMQILHCIYAENIYDYDSNEVAKYIKSGLLHEDMLARLSVVSKHIVFCFPDDAEI